LREEKYPGSPADVRVAATPGIDLPEATAQTENFEKKEARKKAQTYLFYLAGKENWQCGGSAERQRKARLLHKSLEGAQLGEAKHAVQVLVQNHLLRGSSRGVIEGHLLRVGHQALPSTKHRRPKSYPCIPPPPQ
jgi:hypothetical protein